MTPADAARLLAAYDAARYSTDCAPDRALAVEAPALARLVGDLAAEVERLRVDLDRALADGAASHGRYLAADSDYRHQSEKAAKHWQERCEAITERDDARLALAMARGEGWPEGWARYGLTWWSPCECWHIYLTTRNGRPEWILGTMKGPEVKSSHPDALSALRASFPTVTP